LIGAPRARLRSIQVAGARSAAGAALPERAAAGVTTNHARPGRARSSAGRSALRSGAFPQDGGYNPTGTVGALTFHALDAIKTRYLKRPGMLV